MNLRITPVIRLSTGLVALTISLLLAAGLIGLLPDQDKLALEARQKIVESIALQLSWSAMQNDRRTIEQTLTTIVEQNPDILSAALESNRAGTIAVVGNHAGLWAPPEDGRSTPTNVQVPIFSDQGAWGSVQLTFEPLRPLNRFATWARSMPGLVLFFGVVGFLLFGVFLKRALKELDPARVIPDHVKAAFDTLAEGVLIMDEEEHIVLANESFARLVGIESGALIGRTVSSLQWDIPVSDQTSPEMRFPWQVALQTGVADTDVPLILHNQADSERILVVNGSPIVDSKGNPRGALATFDDVSELQKNNVKLQATLRDLAKSKEEVNRQNAELRFLATRDPLTHCLNRRAMLENFEVLFAQARVEKQPLCCVMVDIDHFKSINDRYGHAAGDKVIKFVGNTLQSVSREYDIVARYGGEEFCLVLPGMTAEEGVALAERLRTTITADFNESFTSSRELTVSIGVAALDSGVDSINGLLKRADDALYLAKNSGRNRVVEWSHKPADGEVEERRESNTLEPSHDDTALIPVPQALAEEQTISALRSQVLELDALIEEKAGAVHRKHGFDALTGLPNRMLFYDRVLQALSAAQREGHAVALIYLDISLQQRVGNELTPVTTDEALKPVSERLIEFMAESRHLTGTRRSDDHSMARLGNTEFAIVLPRLEDTEAATWTVQRLFERLEAPVCVNDRDIYANCAAGISLYPTDAEDVEALVGRASQARHMAHAKQGRNTFLYYADDMNIRSYEQIRLEGQLRGALARNEFELHFQPTFRLSSGRIAGFEALLRWNNPEMGQIGPTMFIHIAEQTDLMEAIGEWVLRAACTQARQWQREGFEELWIAVNLSAVQLRNTNLKERVETILAESELDPRYLELEVTETALLDNVERAREALQGLRAHGVSIAMDDFGTGYSSLSHLKHIVVDKLKIDRSFVRDSGRKRDAAVIRSIMAMAKLLGMQVTAEGVENEEQLEFLRRSRCDLAQGYLLGAPVTAKQAREMLGKQGKDSSEAESGGRSERRPAANAGEATRPAPSEAAVD